MSQKNENIIRIIACGVFRPALAHLRLTRKYPNLRFTFLPSVLHTRPQKLKKYLMKKVAAAKERSESIICLYGECFPEIKSACEEQGIAKIQGHSCYEMLLGSERFEKLMEETAGTYFLEKELLLNFRKFCIEPLELYDEEMRTLCFEHYQKLLYVRQPTDPNLVSSAAELAEFLQLSLYITDADYTNLETLLDKVLSPLYPADEIS